MICHVMSGGRATCVHGGETVKDDAHDDDRTHCDDAPKAMPLNYRTDTEVGHQTHRMHIYIRTSRSK